VIISISAISRQNAALQRAIEDDHQLRSGIKENTRSKENTRFQDGLLLSQTEADRCSTTDEIEVRKDGDIVSLLVTTCQSRYSLITFSMIHPNTSEMAVSFNVAFYR